MHALEKIKRHEPENYRNVKITGHGYRSLTIPREILTSASSIRSYFIGSLGSSFDESSKKKRKKNCVQSRIKIFLEIYFLSLFFFFLERVRRKVRFHRSHFFFFKGNFFGLQMSVRGYRSVNYSNEIPLAICFLEIEFERNY